MDETMVTVGRVLNSTTTTFTFGYSQPDVAQPPFGSLVWAEMGADRVYGLVYQVIVRDDAFVRQIVAAADSLTEERIQDLRQRRQVPVEVTALAIAYRQNGQVYQRLPPAPPGALQPIYACPPAEVRRIIDRGRYDYFRTVLNNLECPGEELVAASLRLAAACQPAGQDQAFLLDAGRELARLLAADLPRLDAILRRLAS